MAPSTVARLLLRAGLHRLAELEPAQPENRYEHSRPGDLLHLDVKKLARFHQSGHRFTGDRQMISDGVGWEYVYLAIEPDERGISACSPLIRALRYYRGLGGAFRARAER